MVKIKEGARLSDLDGLNRQFGVTGAEQVFPKRPSAQERLANLKKKRAGLDSPNHQDWYWWSDKEAAEVKDYTQRIEKEKADLDQVIRGVEELVQRLERRQRRVPEGTERLNLEGIYRLHLPLDVDIPSIAAVYQANPSVEYAHAVHWISTNMVPNDPAYRSQGRDAGFSDLYHLTPAYGNFESAWDLSTGKGVLVAVVDTGVQYNHVDLAGNIRVDDGEIAGNGLDDDQNGYVDDVRGFDFHVSRDNNGDRDYDDPGDIRDSDPMDGGTHGTGVAGVVAAVGNNDIGIIGAAFGARIMPIRMLSGTGEGSSIRPEAIRYAIDNGADVINNSWGPTERSPTVDPSTLEVIDDALRAGCIVVFSAGNKNDDVVHYFPNNLPQVLTVGGTAKLQPGKRWVATETGGSNFGSPVDVSAPAERIVVPFPVPSEDGTQDRYLDRTGTSFSAPQVSGLAALLLSYFPSLTSEEIVLRITETARPYAEPDPARPLGRGEIDAYGALTKVVLEPIGPRYVAPGDALDLSIHATGPRSSVVTYSAAGLPPGTALNAQTGRVSGRPADTGSYTVTFTATATPGGQQDSERITLGVGDVNSAPIFFLTQAGFSGKEGKKLSLALNAEDFDGDALIYEAESLPAGASYDRTSGVLRWTPDFNQAGTYPMVISASDGSLTAHQPVTIQIENVNRPPVMGPFQVSPPSPVDEGTPLTIGLTASDPEGDSLTYVMDAPLAGSSFNSQTGRLQWTPGYTQAGTYALNFSVSDGALTSNTITVPITVRNKNGPPELDPIGNRLVNEGEALVPFTVSATEPDNERMTFSVKRLPSGRLPPGASFNASTRVFSWTPTFSQAGIYSFEFKVKDPGNRVDTEVVTITVNNVNRAPTLASIGTQTLDEGVLLTLTPAGSDLDGDPLTYTAEGDPLSLGAVFNSALHQLKWRPTYLQGANPPAEYRVRFTVSDGLAVSAPMEVLIQVKSKNGPPDLAPIEDRVVDENSNLTVPFSATDPDGEAVTYSATGVPAGAQLNAATGVFSWTPSYSQGKTKPYSVTVKAKDAGGKTSAGRTFKITVNNVNRPPVLNAIGNKTIQVNRELSFTLSGSDPDGGKLVYSAALPPAIPASAFTPSSKKFKWKPTAAQVGTHVVVFSVTDGSLSDSESITITVNP